MIGIAKQLKQACRVAAAGLLVLTLAACVATYRNHGYVPTEEELALITVGKDNRDSVLEAVGAPSSSGVLDESGYYYVSSRFRHYGAAAPRVIYRQVVAISFDSRGVVSNVERFGLENGKVIPLERRVTSSGATDSTFLRQLLGNLGNFNPGNFIQ